jgi:hypothetical protein
MISSGFRAGLITASVLGLLLIGACGGGSGGGAPPPSPYFLYAADGKAGVDGNLYRIDPTNAAATVVGPIGYSITGLALAPSGVLYGTESTNDGSPSNLIQIDAVTGAGTVIGPLDDVSGTFNHNSIPGLTWVAGHLIGWSENGGGSSGGDCPVEINISTGTVTVIGGSIPSSGSGLAADASGLICFAPQGPSGDLYEVDPMTGDATDTGITLTGAVINGNVNSMTFLNGVLYLCDNTDNGSPTSPNNLMRVHTGTGMMARIGPLPAGVDAIVGSMP